MLYTLLQVWKIVAFISNGVIYRWCGVLSWYIGQIKKQQHMNTSWEKKQITKWTMDI